jgi:uncharacterized protein (DUF2267 family)
MTENERKVQAFETTLRTSYEWIRDFGESLGQTHAGLCFRCLRAGLHAIRDRLPIDDAAALAAQLPLLIRGVWYDGWRPARVPERARSGDEVLSGIAEELEGGLAAPPGQVLRATIAVMERHVDRGELRKMRAHLPEALRTLWPDGVGSASARA